MALSPALKDENVDVRAAAAFALGKLGNVALPCVATLRTLQQDPRAKVRKAASCALQRLGAEKDVDSKLGSKLDKDFKDARSSGYPIELSEFRMSL
eukprot:gnl/MRDRNA2_/MRDRNA2_187184_c0_seq1.p2 gnl/MRDRNA2_/MRDRNA2_187184_c0~~gnl/MRDRNA2_/MRDRNA2_187184_c0_seq1.p2  ORF type:complete len:106 (+),score=23.75 gnl/MRDRNA2_/MRDRNA2_187184_c0_seq1:33-320(+)